MVWPFFFFRPSLRIGSFGRNEFFRKALHFSLLARSRKPYAALVMNFPPSKKISSLSLNQHTPIFPVDFPWSFPLQRSGQSCLHWNQFWLGDGVDLDRRRLGWFRLGPGGVSLRSRPRRLRGEAPAEDKQLVVIGHQPLGATLGAKSLQSRGDCHEIAWNHGRELTLEDWHVFFLPLFNGWRGNQNSEERRLFLKGAKEPYKSTGNWKCPGTYGVCNHWISLNWMGEFPASQGLGDWKNMGIHENIWNIVGIYPLVIKQATNLRVVRGFPNYPCGVIPHAIHQHSAIDTTRKFHHPMISTIFAT